MPTRRRFLQAAGGITLLAVGGAIWRAHDREVFVTPSGAPYDPWTLWNSSEYKNTPVALVAAGILASNPHNTQPWIFRLSDKQIDILADTSRNLGSFDPYLREMHIGLGCAIENMVLAAPANGYGTEVLFEEGSLLEIEKSGLVHAATIRLVDMQDRAEDFPRQGLGLVQFDDVRSNPGAIGQLAVRRLAGIAQFLALLHVVDMGENVVACFLINHRTDVCRTTSPSCRHDTGRRDICAPRQSRALNSRNFG